MFDVENLNEFINRMFDNAIKSNSSVKVGLSTFRKYLQETSMCDDEYLEVLDKVIDCSEELLALKKKMNSVDVVSFVELTLNNENKIRPIKQKKIGTKPVTSGSCFSSPATSSRCGVSTPSYSNSCYGGSYTNRC